MDERHFHGPYVLLQSEPVLISSTKILTEKYKHKDYPMLIFKSDDNCGDPDLENVVRYEVRRQMFPTKTSHHERL